MNGWRSMLRLARREALRARGRSLLVLLMIALPVLAVTAADVVIQTSDVSGAESLSRRIGAADAEVRFDRVKNLHQMPDPDQGGSWSDTRRAVAPPTLETVSEALARPVRGIERREGSVRVDTDKGVATAEAIEVDLHSPLAEGLFRLVDGRLPSKPGEVLVNPALAERGPQVGQEITVADGGVRASVVGIAESTQARNQAVIAGPLGTLRLPVEDGKSTWLVDAGRPVSWPDVKALNRLGARVLSRDVVEHPPPASEVQDAGGSPSEGTLAVIALIAVMALIEVVLLAGPAFAVGARRQQRNLALIAASGGTPRQMRRVVLASAVVLGMVAAVSGVLLGIVLAFLLVPVAQQFSGSWFGPFDIPWLHLAGVAGFGLASALLAAVVPAVIAARQDVVKVLAGRRGDRKPSLRSPVLGILLLGAGIAGAVHSAKVGTSGELYVAASAVVSVLGMILLVPVVVVGVSRVSRPLPLAVRYAVRDAARHRTRTVPAVAAVASTVVGVVALGIGASSDNLENERTYTPMLASGTGAVSAWAVGPAEWARLEQVVRKALPANTVTAVDAIAEESQGEGTALMLTFAAPDVRGNLLESYGGPLGSSVLVSRGDVPPGLVHLDPQRLGAARSVLAAGGAMVLTSRPVDEDSVQITADSMSEDGGPSRKVRVSVPALYVEAPGAMAPVQAVVSAQVAQRLGVEPTRAGLLVAGPISKPAEADVTEAVGAVSANASFYVERGYQRGDSTVIALIVLGVLGGVLMLGGTLTATFLALSDARPDLATLSAVGAAPRTRRGVAAAYAGTVGLVGAALGAVVGFVPGIAVTYPLTSVTWTDVDARGGALPDHFVDIPWLLIGTVVLVLPLLTALVVGLTARSRLPLVARID